MNNVPLFRPFGTQSCFIRAVVIDLLRVQSGSICYISWRRCFLLSVYFRQNIFRRRWNGHSLKFSAWRRGFILFVVTYSVRPTAFCLSFCCRTTPSYIGKLFWSSQTSQQHFDDDLSGLWCTGKLSSDRVLSVRTKLYYRAGVIARKA